MRILCVTGYYKPAYFYGGPVTSVSTLCQGLVKSGAAVTVFTSNANGPGKTLDVPTGYPMLIEGVQVHYFRVIWPLARLFPFYSPELWRACHSSMRNYDVAYIPGNWTYPTLAGASAAFGADVPYVISPRGSFMDYAMRQSALKKRLYFLLIERQLINRAAAIHVTSRMELQQLDKWDFAGESILIPNGINIEPFQRLPERGRWRRKLGVPPDGTLSLFVGRLHEEKRLDLVIDAFSVVARIHPRAHLLIVGPDQDGTGAHARECSLRLGLSDRIHFPGLLKDRALLQAYSDADLLVLLSQRESFGMVAVEAMAAGLPLLVADEVGLAREIARVEGGLVVKARVEEAAQAWRRLLDHPCLRSSMGSRGKAYVEEQFAMDAVSSQMIGFFSDIA